jgi:hypothetical protein
VTPRAAQHMVVLFHHLSGWVSVAASISPRTVGNSALRAVFDLRIMRKLLRELRNTARGTWEHHRRGTARG